MKFLIKIKIITFLLLIFVLVFIQSSFLSASDIWIRIWGRGYGHGVGMCQWGAYGIAKQGKKYDEILKYYFSGVSVYRYTEATPTVKVLIAESSGSFEISGNPSVSVLNEQTGSYVLQQFSGKVKVEKFESGTSLFFKVYKQVGDTYQPVGTFTGPLKITAPSFVSYYEPSSVGTVRYDYKGYFRVLANLTKKTVMLVNYVGLEDYVYGIAEMPSSWPIEALKAQAVAARTYAYLRIKSSNTYDVADDQSSQVYIGLNKINSSYGQQWKSACDATSRLILKYGTRVASVYYHSTCGGHTENSEDVWLTAYPENRGVVCNYCSESKYYTWETTVSLDAIRAAFNDPTIVYAQVKSRISDRRVDRVLLFKSNGQVLDVSGSTFRSKLGLKSTWFYLSAERIAGSSRYETNRMASEKTFTSASTALIVNGESYPDGISSSFLAGASGGPVLLTSKDVLKATALSELLRLRPAKVIIVGGTGVVSKEVEEKIKSLYQGVQVERINGLNRYETNFLCVKKILDFAGAPSCAFVVSGKSFADAVSVSGLAYKSKAPVVLTDGTNLYPGMIDLLKGRNVQKIIIIGGEGAVSQSLEMQLKSAFQPENVVRWSGKDRYETAYQVAKNSLLAPFSMDSSGCAVATGESFADALSASFFCGEKKIPLVLTPTSFGSYWARKFVLENRPVVRVIFGGEGAVSLTAETNIFSY